MLTDDLRALVDASGLSQRAAASAIGVDQRTFRHILTGKTAPLPFVLPELERLAAGLPTLRQIKIMAEAIQRGHDSGIPFSALIEETGLDPDMAARYVKT